MHRAITSYPAQGPARLVSVQTEAQKAHASITIPMLPMGPAPSLCLILFGPVRFNWHHCAAMFSTACRMQQQVRSCKRICSLHLTCSSLCPSSLRCLTNSFVNSGYLVPAMPTQGNRQQHPRSTRKKPVAFGRAFLHATASLHAMTWALSTHAVCGLLQTMHAVHRPFHSFLPQHCNLLTVCDCMRRPDMGCLAHAHVHHACGVGLVDTSHL